MDSAIFEAILARRSIREYQDKPVERELLEKMLQAAMAAPSAKNGRPWEFVVVTAREKMDAFRACMRYGKHNAPAAICVCRNLALATSRSSRNFWVQDCAAAVQNMLLAASGMGLGTVWVGVYPKIKSVRNVRRVLGIPADITPLALVYVGYPAEEKPARTQYDERRVHWEQYRHS